MRPLFFVHIPKTGGTSLMIQANQQGLSWGEKNPFYFNQPFKHHQPLQWFIPDRENCPRALIKSHNLITVLRDPVERFISDLKWHIEKRPSTLEAFGYSRKKVREDIRPLVHDILDLVESFDPAAMKPVANEHIPFRVRRRFQKSEIRKAGLWKLGYAHFLPQHLFCEFEGEDVISRYFSIDNLAELESFLRDYGISFSSTGRSNRSQTPILLKKAELDRINSVYATDLLFYKSKVFT